MFTWLITHLRTFSPNLEGNKLFAELVAIDALKKSKDAEINARCAAALAIDAHDRINKILEELKSAFDKPGNKYKNVVKTVKRITGKDSRGDWTY